MTPRLISLSALAALASLLAACSSAPPPAPAAPAAKPAAPPAPPPVVHINTGLEKCDKPLGLLQVNEDTGSIWFSQLRGYKLPTASTVLRMLIQQSGCFVWPERAASAKKGAPLPTADFSLSPTLSLTEAASPKGAGGLLESATVTLTLQDSRGGVQLAETEGSARYVDFTLFSPLFAANAGTSSMIKTADGRMVAASFVDAYNLLVRAARNYQLPGKAADALQNALPDAKSSLPGKPNAPAVKTPDASVPKLKR